MIVRVRVLAVLFTAAVLLSACGGGGPGPAEETPAASGGGAFPVTVQHALGSTVIPAAPRRVVSLGYTDQDAILALGVVPVAIREFTGNRPAATWPWASDRLQGQEPQVLVGDEIVAAIDLKTDREKRKLLMQKWTWVGRGTARRHKRRIEEELHRFERFQLAGNSGLHGELVEP